MADENELEKVPEPAEWSSEVAKDMAGEQKPFPMPVHVKDGVYYQEGVGHVDKDGNRIIGLPSDFYQSPFDVKKVADDIGKLKQVDSEIEDKVGEDEDTSPFAEK